ncbi:cytochrome C [Asaia sp. W19]|uniref:cytochrome c n=1 Tax=unclassified Asaia TaxID=2685023 RepID=UPI000F8D082B|nr:cytochrome c [Asaia sp. W19]RUT24811.1 cytochrome C [Asaia sp. W19]
MASLRFAPSRLISPLTNIFRLGLGLVGLVAFPTPAQADDRAVLDRGAYLARAADCVACHTKPGGAPFAGGYGIQSPMGVIYSSNITPSLTHGIGGWSEAAFSRALREGVSVSGRRLYPAMPYDSYAGMTDADIHALYVYLGSAVAPVETSGGPVTALRFPYNMRSLMRVWNWLYLDSRRFEPHPGETTEQARGRYLVEAVAHCGTCHTPRNFMMAAKSGHKLEGARVGGWYAPDIAAGPHGPLAGWRNTDIESYLRTGHARDKGVAAGPMGEAVEHSLRFLTEADLQAITVYLRQQDRTATIGKVLHSDMDTARAYQNDSPTDRAIRNQARQERDARPGPYADRRNYRDIEDGAALYMAACASCHQIDGRGTHDDFYPSLRQSSAVRSSRPNNLVMTILAGVHRDGADGPARMPAYRHDLTDQQIANLVRFVTTEFASGPLTPSPADIAALRRFDTADFPAQARP